MAISRNLEINNKILIRVGGTEV